MDGIHPPNKNFLDKLKHRLSGAGTVSPAQFQIPRVETPDQYGIQAYINQKTENVNVNSVFSLPLIGVREDFATNYFFKAKQIEGGSTHGRRVKHIFLVRRNIERLFYSQYDMKLQDQHSIQPKSREFVRRLAQAFAKAHEAVQKHPDDVLVANIVDPHDPEEEYRRILSFLDVEASALQEVWIRERPITNRFGQYVRDITAEIHEHPFYKAFVQ
jgi:hypothetical protein